MKQRKTPVALIAALVVVGGIVVTTAIYNLPKDEEEQAVANMQAQATVTPSRETPSREQLGAIAKGPRPKTPMEDQPQNISPIPTILLPDSNIVMPQPIETSVSTQWYNENSRLKAKPKKPANTKG